MYSYVIELIVFERMLILLLLAFSLSASGFIVSLPTRIANDAGFCVLFDATEHHTIDESIDCVEVKLSLPIIGTVTLLEATAEAQEVLVNQAIEDDLEHLPSGDPYGAVLWPASTTIASYLLENKESLLKNKRILELGSGTGLISIAATLGGAASVLATDYERIPLKILDYAAYNLNGIDVGTVLDMQLFDLCDDTQRLPTEDFDLIVAADVMYEPGTGKALAHRVLEALAGGCHVLIGDSPGRAGRPAFLSELKKLGLDKALFEDRVGSTVTGHRRRSHLWNIVYNCIIYSPGFGRCSDEFESG